MGIKEDIIEEEKSSVDNNSILDNLDNEDFADLLGDMSPLINMTGNKNLLNKEDGEGTFIVLS